MASPEAEFMLRMEALRREIDARARASALWFILAIALTFGAGYLLGRWR